MLAEGKATAQQGGGCATVMGSSDVLINGKPALTVGSKVACANGKIGIVVGGTSSVLINGRPLAGADARIEGCD